MPLSTTLSRIATLTCLILIPFIVNVPISAFSLRQIFPQPVLLNPSFEDYCTNGTGFFFAPDPSLYQDAGLKNVSSSNSVALMRWNVSGLGLEVVSGGASDGNCYLSPFWAREAGGVNQTLSTAPNASYLVRFDMMIYAVVCGDSFPGIVSIEVSAGEQNATKFLGSATGPWSSSMYQFKASSYETHLSISGSEGSCGIGVDNMRIELERASSSNVLSNGGFESAGDVPEDPGSSGFQLQPGSQALLPWMVTGNGVTCFGSSFFPPTEGQRLIWLATQTSFTQDPGGIKQTMATLTNVTYQISFDAACQCNPGSSVKSPYCQLEVDVGSEQSNLSFTLPAENHTAANPGWSRRAVEFVATSNQTTVSFQDAIPSQSIYNAQYNSCAPYLDNVMVSIPAQQALLRLKIGFGSPARLISWNELSSEPCLIPPSSNTSWAGVTCMGMEVIGLDLSGFGLSGEIPFELFALYPSLESLNLSNNSIGGSIPSFVGNMLKLVTLNLSNNTLQGAIPAELGNLLLQELELQDNQLRGPIPNTLALPSLRVMNLQGNNLSGSVPQGISLLRDNGTILTFTPGNGNLCSQSTKDLLKSCNPSVPSSQSSKGGNGTLPGALGGAAAAVVVLLMMMMLIMWRLRRSKIGQQKIDLKLDTCQAFSLQELEEATLGFTVILGKGGYGTVYKAELKDGRAAAVKRLNHISRQGPQEFIAEVELLSRLHHANLVSLLGYCIEHREHILVYEFMPKGSLYEILHNPASRQPIAWKDRVKIALHIAFGIEYLHYFASPGLVHRDIKSANILLDEKNNAKVADFGLCKEAPLGAEEAQTTAVKGSFGYLDPAYVKTNRLSSKSDVFSYGVILLELITGRRAVTEGELLTEWCKQFYELDVSLMLDPALARNYVEDELVLMVGVAWDCVIEDRELRPNMRWVVHRLCEGFPLLVQPSSSTDQEVLRFDDSYKEEELVIDPHEEEEVDNDTSVLWPR